MEPIRIELPLPWSGTVNAYLFTTPEIVLVDSGVKTETCWEALVAGLAVHGVAVGDISRVVVTHPHIDHFGLAGRITAASEATVWVCELGAPWLLHTARQWADRIAYYRDVFLPPLGLRTEEVAVVLGGMHMFAVQADPVAAERLVTFPPDGALRLGGANWRVIHAPGHASAQTVFYQAESRRLLSADMLLAAAPAPVIDHPESPGSRRQPSLPCFMRSLDVMEALDIERVYPGHGRPFGDHRAVIGRQRERIAARKAQCHELIAAGLTTTQELLDTMYAHHEPATRVAGLWMLLGYLELLLDEGLIGEERIEGIVHYHSL